MKVGKSNVCCMCKRVQASAVAYARLNRVCTQNQIENRDFHIGTALSKAGLCTCGEFPVSHPNKLGAGIGPGLRPKPDLSWYDKYMR